MSEAAPETPTNPPNTGAPNTPETPENPNPQEPNVNPNPAVPQNPTPAPSSPSTGGNQPDLIAELRALPERLANVMNERNPRPTENNNNNPPAGNNGENGQTSPTGKGETWEARFARAWFG